VDLSWPRTTFFPLIHLTFFVQSRGQERSEVLPRGLRLAATTARHGFYYFEATTIGALSILFKEE
jgi:hypothetical protein